MNDVVAETKAKLDAIRIAEAKTRSDAYMKQTQQYLESGNPILEAEAKQRLIAIQSKSQSLPSSDGAGP